MSQSNKTKNAHKYNESHELNKAINNTSKKGHCQRNTKYRKNKHFNDVRKIMYCVNNGLNINEGNTMTEHSIAASNESPGHITVQKPNVQSQTTVLLSHYNVCKY